ncbi:MAG: DNA topoisomerase 3 [Clostridium sp.]|nr:DNA topoisomerase 3 [Clostridium sp.]
MRDKQAGLKRVTAEKRSLGCKTASAIVAVRQKVLPLFGQSIKESSKQMIVCIAEKPSVARDIAHVLGANQSHSGYMEGNGYQVTWTFGHLCELKEPHEYSALWKSWSLSALPMIPQRFGIKLKNDKGIAEQFATIERLMQAADGIVNCGDAGQEGELIQRWVMQKAGVHCPVKRLWISSLTEEAIREGFRNLKDQQEYQSLYEAGLGRAVGDWILGMNATRLYTLKYAQGRQVLSIGRVQTPTLALIVKRQQEIETFTPVPYWVLTTVYRDTTFTAVMEQDEDDEAPKAAGTDDARKGMSVRKGFSTQEEGEAALAAISEAPFTVTDVKRKKGSEAPPRLFDLTSLQVECNRKFAYSADQTLQLIQSLYEKKLTTYPRVDTMFLSDDIYPKCPGILKGLQAYAPLTAPLEGRPLVKSKKVFDSSKVTDHHAIIPTGVPAQNMTDMERNVYDLVARRFIGVFYPDCRFLQTTVLGDVQGIAFKVTGKQITDSGWRVIYGGGQQEAEKTGEEECTLPAFDKGESGPHAPNLAEKWTLPPKPYTEATLLRAMETAGRLVDDEELRDALKENGIGRPSTRAAIIETLFKRRYIRKEKKNLIATPTGVELIGLIHEELLKSAELTGIWERKLRLIEKRAYEVRAFIEELKQMVTDIVYAVLTDNSNRRVTETREEDTVAKKKKPAARRTPAASAARRKKAADTADGQTVSPVSGVSDSPVASTSAAGSPQPQPTSVVTEGQRCPLCGKGHILRGRTAYGCSEWKNGCTFRAPLEQ